jgi:hypothetical protein
MKMQLFKLKENQMAKKLTRAEKIRRYITENPTAKTTEVAKHFETRYQNVYAVRRKMETPMRAKAKKSNWENIGVFTSNKPIAQLAYEAGKSQRQVDKYWEAVGEVQKAGLSPERIAELTAQAGKPKARMEGNRGDPINSPTHYKIGGIETIDFIEAKNLDYNLGNVVKYITRADHKGNKLEDLRKAQWYLTRAIETAK